MNPTIYLALTHDWELRGNGSGDIEAIQFAPMRELLRIYKDAGVRTTFCPDLMQQLTFRQLGHQHPELNSFADKWDEHVCEAFRQGHDIQLHLHPQWRGATYEQGEWKLTSDWSILNYDAASAREMLAAGKDYLEALLQTIDPSYKCVAFRAGALALAPSPHLLTILTTLGLNLDVSIAAGIYLDTRNLKLDYRDCEESFLPFYPQLTDARKISPTREEIVCVPLHTFYSSRRQILAHQWDMARQKIGHKFAPSKDKPARITEEYAKTEWGRKGRSSALAKVYDKGIAPYFKGRHLVADTAHLGYPLLREMLASIREKSAASGQESLPIVVTNHPKDIEDYRPIARFIGELAEMEDVKFITLTELSARLQREEFQIRRA